MGRATRNLKLLDPRVERREVLGIRLALVFAALALALLAVRPSQALHRAQDTGIDQR